MTNKKWYFDTIKEAKAAMPECNKIYKAVKDHYWRRNYMFGCVVPTLSKDKTMGSRVIHHINGVLVLIEKRQNGTFLLDEAFDNACKKIPESIQKDILKPRHITYFLPKQQDSKMTLQNQAKELLPFVQAMAEGKEVQFKCDGEWLTKACPNFVYGIELRIAPETIIVNGFEIEAPMKEEPDIDDVFYFADPSELWMFNRALWNSGLFCVNALSRGLCHKTRDAAIAHAKAMIGIDPNK